MNTEQKIVRNEVSKGREFLTRLAERRVLLENKEKIRQLRIQWEKEKYYGHFKDAEIIRHELYKLGYHATLNDTISIYWEKGRRT